MNRVLELLIVVGILCLGIVGGFFFGRTNLKIADIQEQLINNWNDTVTTYAKSTWEKQDGSPMVFKGNNNITYTFIPEYACKK